MIKRIVTILLLALSMCAFAGEIKTVSINYEYVSDNPNESLAQAKQTALQRAKLKAMEEHFGIDVSSVSNILQRNKQIGKETSSSTDVFSLRETAVRGEWIETIEEKVIEESIDRAGFLHVKVYVKGKARNNDKPKVEVKYALINNTHDRVNRDQYYDGDDIFLRFSTPRSGSLCVYLVDENKDVFCLLPYHTETSGCQLVEANTDYLFFTNETDKDAGYTVNTQRSQEMNAVYIIYTPHSLTKANDQCSGQNWRDERLPRQLSYEDFVKWLSKNQVKDQDMVVLTEVITIRK